MRKMIKKRDIVRSGVTRFAINYLCLQSLVEKKEQLRLMFASEEWAQNSHSKSAKGKVAYATVVSISFGILWFVDSDRPSMSWLYREVQAAIREIKKDICSGLEKNYKPIIDIMESKSRGRLDSSLHLVGYLLNPYYFAKNKVEIGDDATIMEAYLDCVDKFFLDDRTTQGIVSDDELINYKKLEGIFGRKQAIYAYESKGVNEFNPAGWWSNYGGSAPNLKKMATRILSLTTISSGYERNWSTFDGVHTKKRNRIDSERLNNLVYVQFNAKFLYKKRRVSNDKYVFQADNCTKAQHWLVDGVDDESDVDPISEQHGRAKRVLLEIETLVWIYEIASIVIMIEESLEVSLEVRMGDQLLITLYLYPYWAFGSFPLFYHLRRVLRNIETPVSGSMVVVVDPEGLD
ncbi:uncharacterized protein LOC120007337 [Tripterygium wilfordii]|uniref:uncharacterized protein LOC120007337 n=1 Tax=Tripterygium wilfordii TaxID=458696 RepID=UPI0018F840CE|nr:uncharacterized protein LOC120007337 [Tripterygium wilfordii]